MTTIVILPLPTPLDLLHRIVLLLRQYYPDETLGVWPTTEGLRIVIASELDDDQAAT